MISVVERLIESWLDNQTERRYQPAFIQLLISEGWSVLHNTRHSPIELGKDVIARDPSGILYCFQLKGNPGSRITKNEAQSLLPQIIELIDLPPSRMFRKSENERHVAVLVTNGEIDEEARIVLEAAGERTRISQCPAQSFHSWTRGILANRFIGAAGKVWPVSLEGTRQVLDMLSQDGKEVPNPRTISSVLRAIAPRPKSKVSSEAKASSLTALLLIAEILKSRWYETDNHYALYVITVLTSVYGIQFADSSKRFSMVVAYANLALEHCADLLSEASERGFDPDKIWAQRDVFAEFDIMWERRRLIGDCAATLLLNGSDGPEYDRRYAANLVEATFVQPRLWGLGAVPSLIVRYWAVCRVRASASSERHFASSLSIILAANLGRVADVLPLASPYYSFVDCWAFANNLRSFASDSIFADSSANHVWFARAMLFILAKRNRKPTCKAVWSLFSELVHVEPELPHMAFFDGLLSDDGKMRAYTFHQKQWRELVEEAVDDSEGEFLGKFERLAWLFAAYVAIVPYRAWTGVLMWLDGKLNPTWFNRNHLPPV